MKNISLISIILFGAILTSCTFTEKIYINEEGSGSFAIDVDMSKTMEFAAGFIESFDEEDGNTENESVKEPEKIDTSFSFSDLLNDGERYKEMSKKQKDALESLKGGKMLMHMDEAEKEMQMTLLFDFANVKDLKDMMNKMANASSFAKKDQIDIEMFSAFNNTGETVYFYDEKIFKRQVSRPKQSKKQKEEIDKSIEQMGMLLAGSEYKLEYHFPKAIKSTSAKNATFSDDKKTLFISYPFSEVLEDGTLLNFEVKF
jgi:hypothetical protein